MRTTFSFAICIAILSGIRPSLEERAIPHNQGLSPSSVGSFLRRDRGDAGFRHIELEAFAGRFDWDDESRPEAPAQVWFADAGPGDEERRMAGAEEKDRREIDAAG